MGGERGGGEYVTAGSLFTDSGKVGGGRGGREGMKLG